MSLCSFPTFSFSFDLSVLVPLPKLPSFDIGFTLAIPLPITCPLD